MKHTDFEIYEWVKRVILSCKTTEQLASAHQLYLIFITKLQRENSKNAFTIRTSLYDIVAITQTNLFNASEQ